MSPRSGRLPPSQRQGLGSYIFALVCPSPPPHTLGGRLGRWLVLSGPSGGHQAMVCEHLAPSPAPHPAPSLSPTWASHPGPASSFFFFFFVAAHVACRILVPRPGIKPMLFAAKAQSPNHQTAWKSLALLSVRVLRVPSKTQVPVASCCKRGNGSREVKSPSKVAEAHPDSLACPA